MLLTYEEMSKRAFEFYDNLQINIPKKYVSLAVRSLTMPQYAITGIGLLKNCKEDFVC